MSEQFDLSEEIKHLQEKIGNEKMGDEQMWEKLNRADAVLSGRTIDLEEAEPLDQIFEEAILDLNDELLGAREKIILLGWIEDQLGCAVDEAPIKTRYRSPDGETEAIVYNVPLGPANNPDDKWYISRWQNKNEKPSFVLWPEETYELQVGLGYEEVD